MLSWRTQYPPEGAQNVAFIGDFLADFAHIDRAQEYTNAIDWRDLGTARLMLELTGAFAEGENTNLDLPAGMGAA